MEAYLMLTGLIWRLVGMLEMNMKQLLSLYSSPPLPSSPACVLQ